MWQLYWKLAIRTALPSQGSGGNVGPCAVLWCWQHGIVTACHTSKPFTTNSSTINPYRILVFIFDLSFSLLPQGSAPTAALRRGPHCTWSGPLPLLREVAQPH